jgi:hypothetical protein
VLALAYVTLTLNLMFLLLVTMGWMVAPEVVTKKYVLIVVPYIVGAWFALSFILGLR